MYIHIHKTLRRSGRPGQVLKKTQNCCVRTFNSRPQRTKNMHDFMFWRIRIHSLNPPSYTHLRAATCAMPSLSPFCSRTQHTSYTCVPPPPTPHPSHTTPPCWRKHIRMNRHELINRSGRLPLLLPFFLSQSAGYCLSNRNQVNHCHVNNNQLRKD